MNTIISTNRNVQNFNGKLNLKGSTPTYLRDVVDYKNYVASNKKKDSPEFQKDLNQFFNTLKLIKNNKIVLDFYFFMLLKSDEKDRFFWFNCDASCKGLPSITPLNWEIGYGDFHKTRKYQGKCDPIKNTIKYVIEIGKQAFGEKKLKKPISDLEKHRISQDIIKMDNEYRLG